MKVKRSLSITYEEEWSGVSIMDHPCMCIHCDGEGEIATDDFECPCCSGEGVHEVYFDCGAWTEVDCEKCHGTGKVSKEKCKDCHGMGIQRKQEEINVKIPAGINNGEMIRLSGAGEAVTGGVAGDLYIKVRVTPHKYFRKEGVDLKMDLEVKLSDALLGAEYTVETLDGKIKVKIPKGVTHGEMLRVRGKGVPVSEIRRGDLFIKIKIKLPNKLSRKAKQLVEDLKKEGI